MSIGTVSIRTAAPHCYVLQHTETRLFARFDTEGEHDGKVTDDVGDAKEFKTWGDASRFNQNFGNFEIVDLFWDAQPQVDMGSFYRAVRNAGGMPEE